MAPLKDGHTCRTFLVGKKLNKRWTCGGCGAVWQCKQTKRTTILGRPVTELYWLQIKSGNR